jgi:excisionase family DNA binding protein
MKHPLFDPEGIPRYLTPAEVATLLRTSLKAVYSMVARGQLPGVIRVHRRLLVESGELLQWLDHTCALSPKEKRR